MQDENDIKRIPTVSLINSITLAEEQGNQSLVNYLAYELACRLYVPNKGVDFDKLLAGFGYRDEEQEVKTEDNVKSLRRKK